MFPYKLAAEGRDKRCIYKLQAYSAYGTVVYKMLNNKLTCFDLLMLNDCFPHSLVSLWP